MKIEYQNYIGVYKNVYPEGYCKFLIDEVEACFNNGAGYTRLQAENNPGHIKNDIALNGMHTPMNEFNKNPASEVFFEGLQKCYKEYSKTFSILEGFRLSSHDMKIQKTGPGGGYHVWHTEQGSVQTAQRVLVFILYLNTINKENAGETEFLYEQKRFSPEENTLIIWPASYTHTHRGNPVFNTNKYIVTGWFSLN